MIDNKKCSDVHEDITINIEIIEIQGVSLILGVWAEAEMLWQLNKKTIDKKKYFYEKRKKRRKTATLPTVQEVVTHFI